MIKSLTKALIETSRSVLEGIRDIEYATKVNQMQLVRHIKKQTGKKVYFDGTQMVSGKTDKTIHFINPKKDKVGDLVKIAKKKA
jgi:hypothetical protein